MPSATTERYAHFSDDPLRATNKAIGNQITAAMRTDKSGKAFNLGKNPEYE